MSIQVLDKNTIDKIAAGEVIERPSSVVKELVENAIDAKATAITIEIKDGGISFIRVTDNGTGISKEDIPLAFLRHSTSKIKSVEDLISIKSLGFRGEALSSISSVAQVELITKTSDNFTGYRYVIEGGEEKSMEEAGVPDGTTFIVRNLFYNTPVRRKFLKTATTEAGYINALIEHLSLSHPDVSFRFINNNQNKLHTSGNTNLKDIIYSVYGRDITRNLIQVSAKTQDIQIDGFIGKPMICRGNRSYENYYINGRYIKSGIITKAIEEAYKGHIMPHNYPFTALHFTINQEILDVNVHPTKMELRFSKNEFVYNFVLSVIKNALEQRELIPEVRVNEPPSVKAQRGEFNVNSILNNNANSSSSINRTFNNYTNGRDNLPKENVTNTSNLNNSIKEAVAHYGGYQGNTFNAGQSKVDSNVHKCFNENKEKEVLASPLLDNNIKKDISLKNESVQNDNKFEKERLPEPFEKKRSELMVKQDAIAIEQAKQADMKATQMSMFEDKLLDKTNTIQYRIIGQLFDTYWLIEFEDKFYMMDQHAAHEKVLYERFMKRLANKQMDSQMIMPPVILSVNMREQQVLVENMDIFKSLGYEIEEFGGNEYKVMGMPSNLPKVDCKQLLIDMLDNLVDDSNRNTPEIITERIASMSCKAAVKGNNRLSMQEAKELMKELMEADNPYNCPHGRPTLIMMTKYEIEKKFKRIL